MNAQHSLQTMERLYPYACQQSLENSVWYLGALFTFLATGQQTQGQFTLMEAVARKGDEPARHIHYREDEAFYLLEGEITFYVGDQVYHGRPGTFVFLPRAVPHSFTFETEAIKMLVLAFPSGVEGHFRDPQLSQPAQALTLPPPFRGPLDAATVITDLTKYGIEVVGPPGPPLKG